MDFTSSGPPDRITKVFCRTQMTSSVKFLQREAGQILESFAVQLVCLAIWKESLHVCIRWAAQAEEGNQTYADHGNIYTDGAYEPGQEKAAATACSSMEREFSAAVDRAEELALHVRVLDGKIVELNVR